MNKLVSLLSSCDLADVTSLRKIYHATYQYYGTEISCDEENRNSPEWVRFFISFPLELLGIEDISESDGIVVADYCLREFAALFEQIDFAKEHKTGKEKYTGTISILKASPIVTKRSSSYYENGAITISLKIRFPVHMMEKRNVIAGKASVKIVKRVLATVIRRFVDEFDSSGLDKSLCLYRHQQEIRKLLKKNRLIGFIANGSILPRTDGDAPLDEAKPFISPAEDEVEFVLSDGFKLKGMAIQEGVTVITGGSYSGKSTFLNGLLSGIYDHTLGDGREYCLLAKESFKLCAEDGRPVHNLDITPFIKPTSELDTTSFSSSHASGSTSQAANLMEALAFGCKVILVDEDRTATNFMIRDARMKEIIKNDPVTPFTDRVQQIYQQAGTSTILIIGGSSEFLDVADHVYLMEAYTLKNYSAEIEKSRQHTASFYSRNEKIAWVQKRIAQAASLSPYKKLDGKYIREYVDVNAGVIRVGNTSMDISRVESIASIQQQNAIAFIILKLFKVAKTSEFNLYDVVSSLYKELLKNGLHTLYSSQFDVEYDMELPTLQDILFCISRIDEGFEVCSKSL